MNPTDYQTLVAMNLARHKAHPGDMITLTLRNEDTNDGMFSQAKRLSDMFLMCYAFWPTEIAIHPEHLELIKKLGKTIDVTVPEEVNSLLGKLIKLTDLPRRIPLVGDDTLDLFTAVARYHFRQENTEEFLEAMIHHLLKEM